MKEAAIEDSILDRMPWVRSPIESPDPVLLLTREWLVTNGLGGYASASVSGACTRRYHGLLVAALPARLGRMVMLSHFREHEAPVSLPMEKPYAVRAHGDQYEISSDGNIPPLRVRLDGPNAGFVLDGGRFKTIFYRVEQSRGYECRGPLWSPGYFRTTLRKGETFTVVASTEPWEKILALAPEDALQQELTRRRTLAEIARPEV